MNLSTLDRQSLRHEIREARRSLTPQQQQNAALAMSRVVIRQPIFMRAKRMGFYLSNDGEINPSALLEQSLSMGKSCHLPVLRTDPGQEKRLWFFPYDSNTPLEENRYGIPEPRPTGEPTALTSLDIVFVPLVAFDKRGGRLGMGGGYYDRSFAFRTADHNKPLLIGLAHSCQAVSELTTESWDVPLDAIITESGVHLGQNSDPERHFLSTDYVVG